MGQVESYSWTTIAGVAPDNVDGDSRVTKFNQPFSVCADDAGNVYVADTENHTIRKLTLAGTNWISATIAGRGWFPFYVDGTNSLFNAPSGIASDGAGNLIVADYGNNVIRKLSPAGTNWVATTIAGYSDPFFPGPGGSADGTNATARFWGPTGVAVGNSGTIYIADGGNATIRKITRNGTNWVTSTIAGSP